MFLANYSDGLADVNIAGVIETFRQSGKIACFLAVRPSFSLHFVEIAQNGKVDRIRASRDANLWVNGGFFVFRPEISTACAKARNWLRRRLTADRDRSARPLKRFVQRYIETAVAKELLRGEVLPGEALHVTVHDGQCKVNKK